MLTGATKMTQSRRNTGIRIRCTTSGNRETPTTTRVAWITKLISIKTPPALRWGGPLIRLHLLQELVGFLKDFTLDRIMTSSRTHSYSLALSWLLIFTTLTRAFRSRIASSGSECVVSIVLLRVWRARDTEFDWLLPSNFLSLSSEAFQFKTKQKGSGKNLTKSPYTLSDPA